MQKYLVLTLALMTTMVGFQSCDRPPPPPPPSDRDADTNPPTDQNGRPLPPPPSR